MRPHQIHQTGIRVLARIDFLDYPKGSRLMEATPTPRSAPSHRRRFGKVGGDGQMRLASIGGEAKSSIAVLLSAGPPGKLATVPEVGPAELLREPSGQRRTRLPGADDDGIIGARPKCSFSHCPSPSYV